MTLNELYQAASAAVDEIFDIAADVVDGMDALQLLHLLTWYMDADIRETPEWLCDKEYWRSLYFYEVIYSI